MKRKSPSDWELQPNSSRLLVSSPVGSNEILVGRTRLSEGIDRLFTTSDLTRKTGVRALGIHGASGMGKTTLAKMLCEFYYKEYDGRVCLLELGSMTVLSLLKKVLQELSLQQDKGTLSQIVDAAQAWNALEDGMKVQNKVFLVIDNISSDQSFVAERFTKMRFAQGSRLVLITRNPQVLLQNIGLPVACCEAMPSLTEQEAMELFIQTGNCEMKDEQDKIAVKKWVSRCHHRSYYPLFIKVLADATTTAMGRRPSEWTDSILDFNYVSEVPRLGYESLPPTYRLAFVSLLLFAPSKDFVSVKPSVSVHSVKSICRWLAIVHNMDESRALTFLHGMKAKNVLESWQDMSDHLRIHDSFKEFAERELQQGRFKSTHRLWKEDRNIPHELKTSPSNFCAIKVLKLVNCLELKTLDLGYMTELRYLVVEGCWKLESIHGLKKLRNLVWLQCNKCRDIDMPLLSDLQVLRLEGSTGEAANVTGFQGMRELALVKAPHLQRAPELSSLTTLEILILNGCSKLKEVSDLSALSSCLRSLHLSECSSLESIPGLERLKALRHLGLSKCSSLQRIPSLQRLRKLKFLDLSATAIREAPGGMHALRELVELHVTSLSKFPGDVLGLRKLRKIFWRGCLVGRDGVMLSESKALPLGDESDDDDENSGSESGESTNSGDEEEAACDEPGSDDTDEEEDEEEHLHSQDDDEEVEEEPSGKEEDDDDYDGSAEEPEENSAESSSDGDSD